MFGSFRDEILINGVIRELDLIHHPNDIIVIIHRYYEQLGTTSFIIREQQRDYIHPNNFWWKISEKTVDSTQDISLNHNEWADRRWTIYPQKFHPWYQPLTPLSDYDKYSHSNQLQYHFAIQRLDDIRQDIHIGIIPYRYVTGHSSYFVQTVAGFYNLFTVEKYPDFSNKFSSDNYKTNANKLLCFAYAQKGNLNNDIISINIDCLNRKIYFLWNGQIIHTIHVQVNIPYIPVVWYKGAYCRYPPQKIEYKVLSMSSNRIGNANAICPQTEDENFQRFIYQNLWDLGERESEYSSNDVIDLLWSGYKLIYNKIQLYNEMVSYTVKPHYLLEIYQYFYRQFVNHINEMLSDKLSFTNDCDPYIGAYIASVISDYAIDPNVYSDHESYMILHDPQYHEMREWIKWKLSKNEDFTYTECHQLFGGSLNYPNYTDYDEVYYVDYDVIDDDDFEDDYHCMQSIEHDGDKLCELAINYNHSKDNHRKRHLYDNIRYKTKNKKKQNKQSTIKRKKDRASNCKSKLKFQKRYQMSLQY